MTAISTMRSAARVCGQIVGPPGIGKSRLVPKPPPSRQAAACRCLRTYCESHTREIPFHAVARLLRAASG